MAITLNICFKLAKIYNNILQYYASWFMQLTVQS